MLTILQVLVFSFLTTNATNVASDLHEFHLSKCIIEYNAQEKAIQVSMQLFIDDLEVALERQGKDKLYICTDKEVPEAETYMEAYLREHFILKVNGQNETYNFLGKEVSEDFMATWCYIEIENVESLKELGIKFDVLTEVFEDQKNVIQLFGPNKKRGTILLDNRKTEETIKF